MSVYIIKVTEQYRCDTEEEALKLIEKAKKNATYTVSKFSNEIKTSKAKGEVIDEWHRVTITKEYCTEKEPDPRFTIKLSNRSIEYYQMEDEDEEEYVD